MIMAVSLWQASDSFRKDQQRTTFGSTLLKDEAQALHNPNQTHQLPESQSGSAGHSVIRTDAGNTSVVEATGAGQ